MSALLMVVELLVGVLVAAVCLALAGVFVRRRAIARGSLLTLCALRPPQPAAVSTVDTAGIVGGAGAGRDARRWRLGLLRLGASRLEFFPLLGLTLRPVDGWERLDLDLDAPAALAADDRIDLLPDAVGVRCLSRGKRFELALQPLHYTALRSWLEAAPPGSRANVA